MSSAAGDTTRSTIDRCLDEFDDLWDRGRKPRASNFRDRFDSVNRTDFVELIYQEFCRSEADGIEARPEDFLHRYSEFRAELQKLFAVHYGLDSPQDSPDTAKPDDAAIPEMPIPGDSIGPYRLTRVIGQGGMGSVFLARQTDLSDRQVVIKIVRIGSSIEPEHQARVDHPNVMPVYRHFRTDDGQFLAIVMPHLPGLSADRLLTATGTPARPSKSRSILDTDTGESDRIDGPRIDISRTGVNECIDHLKQLRHGQRISADWNRQIAIWGFRLARALQATFQRGIVHGDVKPGNIFIGADLQPYLLDFHLSRRWNFDRHKAVFEHDDPGGTLAYMPPERLDHLLQRLSRHDSPKGPVILAERARHAHRADLYSLSLVLLELLTGHSPVPSEQGEAVHPAETARKLAALRNSPRWLKRHPGFSRLPAGWRAFLERSLQADPAQRHSDGIEYAETLEILARERKHSGPLRKLLSSRTVRSSLLVSVLLGTLVSGGMVVAEYRRQTHVTRVLWQAPYEFWSDPSSFQDRTISSRVASGRADFDRLSGLASAGFAAKIARLFSNVDDARLDSDLWLADRIEHLSRYLAQRALRTDNEQDASAALKLISTGSRNWRTVSWANREKELVSKFGRKPGETTADRKYDPLISEYVELIESETNDPKSDDRRWNGLIRQAPASFAIRWGYVRFLAKSDRIPDAIRQAKAALAIEPGHFETRRLLAQLQFRDRQFENALNEIEIALATRHDDISALRIRSILRLYAGHREELLSEIDRMGEILNMESEITPDDPGNPVTRNETLFPKGLESNEVLDTRTVERIHGMFPKDREVTTLLVKKYYNEKRFGEAIELMERIPASGPRSTQDLINLAILYRNDFRKEKAIELGKELITRDDFAVWLNKRKSIRNFYYLLLKDFEVIDPKSTLRIYRILADKMSNIITNKGLWHFQFARLNLIEFGRSGLEESINQLKFAGQQHMVYIQKWYEGDPAFDPYREEIDASLKSFFRTSPTRISVD